MTLTASAPTDAATPARAMGTSVVFAAVLLPLLAIYSLTAQWGLPYHIDAMTNAISGWYIGNEGTVIADQHDVLATPEQHANLGWFVPSPEGTVGQYPPGAALVAGIAYALAPDDGMTTRTMVGTNFDESGPATFPVPPMWPATLTAVLTTAAAAAVLALVFLGFGGDPRHAIAGGLLFGLATGAWSVASTMSWTHGPAMLAVALALLGVQRERWLLAGLAFGFGILCRPHLAIVAAVVGIAVAARRRDWKPAVGVGAGAGAGLALLLAYNYAIFHELTISGGYGEVFEEQFTDNGLGWFVRNVTGGLVDPTHGLLVWAPFLLVLIPAVVLARREVSPWTIAAALGGALYLIVQFRANAFAGGEGHFGYRYPLEPLTAAAPALYLGYQRWVQGRQLMERIVVLGFAAAFAGQLSGVLS